MEIALLICGTLVLLALMYLTAFVLVARKMSKKFDED